MRFFSTLILVWLLPAVAWSADKESADPAIIVLLLLGLAAIIGGLTSIGDMRRKQFMPPRPGNKPDAEPPPGEERQPSSDH